MTIRIPQGLALGLLALLASWAGAFGIAVGVSEWRTPDIAAKQEAFAACAEDAWDAWSAIAKEELPRAPRTPATSAGEAAYQQQFQQYYDESQRFNDRHQEAYDTYVDEHRDCLQLLR